MPFMNTKVVLDDAEIVRLGKKVPSEYPCLLIEVTDIKSSDG